MRVKEYGDIMPAGRKTKLTPERINKLCRYLREGQTVRVACGMSGIVQSTYYRWIEEAEGQKSGKKKEFKDRIERAQCHAERRMQVVVRMAGLSGDWKAAIEWLKLQRPKDWTNRIEIIEYKKVSINLEGCSDIELEKMEEILTNGNGNGRNKPIVQGSKIRQTNRLNDS